MKEYKKYKYGKLFIIAKIIKLKNGKYGFSTSTDNGQTFETNINMPFFCTEEGAKKWIENNEQWQ